MLLKCKFKQMDKFFEKFFKERVKFLKLNLSIIVLVNISECFVNKLFIYWHVHLVLFKKCN